MRRLAAVLALAGTALAAQAQTIDVAPLNDPVIDPAAPPVTRMQVTEAAGGVTLRAIDKLSGEVVDFDLEPGQIKQLGYILVTLGECRYPTLNPAGDAFAYLQVRVSGDAAPVFAGWMIASSPSLNALDHARYDVWPLRCRIAAGD